MLCHYVADWLLSFVSCTHCILAYLPFNHRLLASERLYFAYIHHTCLLGLGPAHQYITDSLPGFSFLLLLLPYDITIILLFFFLVTTYLIPPRGRLLFLRDLEWGWKSGWIEWIGGR